MLKTSYNLDPEIEKNVSQWLHGHYDEKTKEKIRQLLHDNLKEAIDAFYTTLSFGTGGMRGIMGVGSNRMNDYTIRAATQGLANYVNKQPPPLQGHSAFIGYDSRHHSRTFAEEAAKVLAANGIRVYLCKDIRPTPYVSFGCRFYECTTAIMITASHNPPQYNGYKVYWNDGGQVLPPHDTGIIADAAKITDPTMVKTTQSLKSDAITLVGEDVDAAYIDEASIMQLYSENNSHQGKELSIVYTSLHGTGISLMPKMLAKWGFSNVAMVDEQIIPDGDFPTTKYPNPEMKEALSLGIKKLTDVKGDILIATDPDADRVGVVVQYKGQAVQLTGNQVAAILLAHICEALKMKGAMPKDAAFIKSIVTTELFQAICDDNKKPCFNVLPGFKYIAEKIHRWEESKEHEYVFGGEESCGYLYGTLTRDKDGILIGALICEAALLAKKEGKTLIDILHHLYQKYGVYFEDLLSLNFEESKVGQEKMRSSMEHLRQHMPRQIEGVDVVAVEDYQSSERQDLKSSKREKLSLPVSNVLTFWLADHTKIVVRPSGTEPKVKFYCGVHKKADSSIEKTIAECQQRTAKILETMKQLLLG